MFSIEKALIEESIFILRGLRIMLDSDLAELYGVETKRLNEAVRRNRERFPEDFMFECTSNDLEDLRTQFATSNRINAWKHMRRVAPMVFTENGVAMLSGVLHSPRAVEVNISIMRTFTKLRGFKIIDATHEARLSNLENSTHKLFKLVFERLDVVDEILAPRLAPRRKKIGLKD